MNQERDIEVMAGACVVSEGKTLLLQMPSGVNEVGAWGPPGGHGKYGEETIQEIAIREVKEETGLDIVLSGLVQASVMILPDGRQMPVVLYYAETDIKDIVIDNNESSNFVWATLVDIENDKYPLREDMLKEPLTKALRKEYGPVDSFAIVVASKQH